MEFETVLQGHTLIVYLHGDVDLNVADRLREQLDIKIEETAAAHLLVDFSGVSFIDSSGLGVILGRYKKISAAGGKVFLTGARSHVRKVLEISGLLRIMQEFDTAGEALTKIV